MICNECGGELALAWENLGAHPQCVRFDDPWRTDPLAEAIKDHLIEMIKWADRTAPRSLQREIGPSEISAICDRRIGYRIAEVPEVNLETDPWAAIVGTAIHAWLESATTRWGIAHGDDTWRAETVLHVDELVTGRSDAYWCAPDCVIDYKGIGSDKLHRVRMHGPPEEYVTQVQLYGYGFAREGYPVKKVALVFIPRSGWLRDIFPWTDDYRPEVAQRALARLRQIARQVIDLDILNNGHRWEDLTPTPSNACGFCPWYNPDRDLERGASELGCPGR